MPDIELSNTEPIEEKPEPETLLYIFTCKGCAWYRPRIVSRRVSQNVVNKYISFVLKFYEWCYDIEHSEPEYLYGKIEDKVRSQIEHSCTYTDVNGVIKDFLPPSGPWWIEVESISWIKAPPEGIEPPREATNPITIDSNTGEVVYGV
jgi:hypothetical protein